MAELPRRTLLKSAALGLAVGPVAAVRMWSPSIVRPMASTGRSTPGRQVRACNFNYRAVDEREPNNRI